MPATKTKDIEKNYITLENVEKWYGSFHVLKNINLTIKKSEKIVICGPSGSGKSTLIRCLNQLESQDQGTITIDGIKVHNDPHTILQVRKEVGMIFQQFNLFPHLTVLENLCLAPVRVKKMKSAEAEKLAMNYLERVKIPKEAHKYPSQLSGGQQQRVAIARALCMAPKVMLCDEPTSALDPEMTKEVLEVMVELASSGMTMICVTHEMAFARQIADRVVFMDAGEMIEVAPPETFFTRPQSARTQKFLGQML